jgi:hypothetical protein
MGSFLLAAEQFVGEEAERALELVKNELEGKNLDELIDLADEGEQLFDEGDFVHVSSSEGSSMPKRGRSSSSSSVRVYKRPRGVVRMGKARPMAMTAFHSRNCVEKKYHDVVLASQASATAGTLFGLVGGDDGGATQPDTGDIKQGSAATERIGEKIYVYDLDINLQFNAGDNLTGNWMRIIIFVDKQSNGTIPATTELLESAVPYSLRNLENTKRFHVLQDKYFNVTNTGAGGSTAVYVGGAKQMRIHHSFGANGLKVQYSTGADGDAQDIKDNNVWMLILGSGTGVTTSFHSRIRYSD